MKRFSVGLFLVLGLTGLVNPAQAGPYFQFKPGSKLSMGAFFRPGAAAEQINWGQIVPVIVHEAKDGYLLVPGVDWDLLDVGWTIPVGGGGTMLALGPTVNLEEPIKVALRRMVDALPGASGPGAYGVLRAILAPVCEKQPTGTEGKACQEPGFPTLALGPMFALQSNPWRGSFILGAALVKRF